MSQYDKDDDPYKYDKNNDHDDPYNNDQDNNIGNNVNIKNIIQSNELENNSNDFIRGPDQDEPPQADQIEEVSIQEMLASDHECTICYENCLPYSYSCCWQPCCEPCMSRWLATVLEDGQRPRCGGCNTPVSFSDCGVHANDLGFFNDCGVLANDLAPDLFEDDVPPDFGFVEAPGYELIDLPDPVLISEAFEEDPVKDPVEKEDPANQVNPLAAPLSFGDCVVHANDLAPVSFSDCGVHANDLATNDCGVHANDLAPDLFDEGDVPEGFGFVEAPDGYEIDIPDPVESVEAFGEDPVKEEKEDPVKEEKEEKEDPAASEAS